MMRFIVAQLFSIAEKAQRVKGEGISDVQKFVLMYRTI